MYIKVYMYIKGTFKGSTTGIQLSSEYILPENIEKGLLIVQMQVWCAQPKAEYRSVAPKTTWS